MLLHLSISGATHPQASFPRMILDKTCHLQFTRGKLPTWCAGCEPWGCHVDPATGGESGWSLVVGPCDLTNLVTWQQKYPRKTFWTTIQAQNMKKLPDLVEMAIYSRDWVINFTVDDDEVASRNTLFESNWWCKSSQVSTSFYGVHFEKCFGHRRRFLDKAKHLGCMKAS